jgi:hypothetical protein
MDVLQIFRKAARCRKGQSIVELTLIFPMLVALLYTMIEVANIMITYHAITSLTREAANLASRGEDPDAALDAVIATSGPTVSAGNAAQWNIIYSRIIQDPADPCPPTPCTYIIESQELRGSLGQPSQLGSVGSTVTIAGIDGVAAGQTFHAVEIYYNYGPNIMTYVGSSLNQIFYDRTIFTNVSRV